MQKSQWFVLGSAFLLLMWWFMYLDTSAESACGQAIPTFIIEQISENQNYLRKYELWCINTKIYDPFIWTFIVLWIACWINGGIEYITEKRKDELASKRQNHERGQILKHTIMKDMLHSKKDPTSKDIKEFKDHITLFRIMSKKGSIKIIHGEKKRIVIETDAPDDFLTREKNPGSLECQITGFESHIRIGFLKEGKISIYVSVDENAKIGANGKLVCRLKCNGHILKENSKNLEITGFPSPLPTPYPPIIWDDGDKTKISDYKIMPAEPEDKNSND